MIPKEKKKGVDMMLKERGKAFINITLRVCFISWGIEGWEPGLNSIEERSNLGGGDSRVNGTTSQKVSRPKGIRGGEQAQKGSTHQGVNT